MEMKMTITKIIVAVVVSLYVSVAHADQFVSCDFYDHEAPAVHDNPVIKAGWLIKGTTVYSLPGGYSYLQVSSADKNGDSIVNAIQLKSTDNFKVGLRYNEKTETYDMLKKGEVYRGTIATAPHTSSSSPIVANQLAAPEPSYNDKLLVSSHCTILSLNPSAATQQVQQENIPGNPTFVPSQPTKDTAFVPPSPQHGDRTRI
jgi:hypothetical protein